MALIFDRCAPGGSARSLAPLRPFQTDPAILTSCADLSRIEESLAPVVSLIHILSQSQKTTLSHPQSPRVSKCLSICSPLVAKLSWKLTVTQTPGTVYVCVCVCAHTWVNMACVWIHASAGCVHVCLRLQMWVSSLLPPPEANPTLGQSKLVF
jgi:hypothetical protein